MDNELLEAIRAIVREEAAEIRAEMADGFEKVHGDIGDLQRNSDKNMKLINEGLGHLTERYAQLDTVERTVKNHGDRIFALEQRASGE